MHIMTRKIKKPRVSAIIPVFNGERYLAETIHSVSNQNCSSLEIVVVDDGSTDASARIASRFRSVKYFYQRNRGTAAALNTGIEQASGDFLSFLDADDLWTHDKTIVQIAAFQTNPNLDIVSGHVQQFFSPDLSEADREKIRFPKELMPGHVIPAMLIKREAFFKVGYFETKWELGAGMSWYLRAMDMGLSLKILPDIVLMRRIHRTNKGITKRQFAKQRAHILKIALDRRRNRQSDKHNCEKP